MNKRRWWIFGTAAALILAWLLCLPRELFRGTVYSTVVESAEGELLGARIADDGQWRFPPSDTVPERFAAALIQFEDKRFRWHPGVDLLAIGRALKDNIKEGHTVSGGSTITMQVIRLSRGKERTLWQKAIEAVQATRLELRYSKKKILALYASHAPFGGNVVGLEAAAWRYFGRPAAELSWAESATLAVLPNSPSSMHPGKNREQLLSKRNRLLERLCRKGYFDAETLEASLEEPLPEAPLQLPSYAKHYVEHCKKGEKTVTGIQFALQKAVEEVCDRRSDNLADEGIADMAAVVIDNRSGEIIAYVGNTSPGRKRPGVDVDIAASPRSTGSILKPALYAAALEEGTILPGTLLPDVPVNLSGFAPQNFDHQFYGAVPANEALARSLNIPAVFLLQEFGVPKFLDVLRKCNITTLENEASHYGLSLILGGGECRLDQVARMYSQMAVTASEDLPAWYTLDALKEVNRPDELDWRLIRSVRKAAWKTGTSYGFRDAWAVGMTPSYTIGVWAGNAQGQGVAGLTGARAAGPVMFDILNLLPAESSWFEMPGLAGHDGGLAGHDGDGRARTGNTVTPGPDRGSQWAKVCAQSGYLAGPDCTETEDMLISDAGLQTEPCPYHRSGEFVLPPAMEWYYRPHHPEYKGATRSASAGAVIAFIYPSSGSTLELPRQLSGEVEGAVFRAAHHNPAATIWWHMDGSYIGETQLIHEMKLSPAPGKHVLTIVDENGNTAAVTFTVAGL
ncbi:MAG: transglycosylase domain-containing protein [Bacteroidales bacterium]|nr:transglycosylase domain-containing protein [Bacteroidales bacterium]